MAIILNKYYSCNPRAVQIDLNSQLAIVTMVAYSNYG